MLGHLRPVALILGSIALIVTPDSASAQFGRRLKDALKQNAENRAIQEVVQQENKAIDAALTAEISSSDDAAGGKLYDELANAGRLTVDGLPSSRGRPR